MRNQSLAEAPAQTPDARKFARKRIPLSAKMLDLAGKTAIDCTIQDMSLVGAQVSLPTAQPIPEAVYLIDVTNCVAYKANVAWWRPHLAGFAFQERYPLDEDTDKRPAFLKRVWVEAKLEQVDSLTAHGRSLPEAVQMAGLSGTAYAQLNSERAHDSDLILRLWKLETENAALRQMVAELTGKSFSELG